MHHDPSHSRPITPESPLTSSLYHATSTIDDLTLALSNFSRIPSPEPPSLLACCCGRDQCDNFKAWLELKSRLETRLILSAEVGQALLQRHEAYVRRHKAQHKEGAPESQNTGDEEQLHDDTSSMNEYLDLQLSELIREKAILEKRLNQALVNNEVTEISNKSILQELQEARSTISRLTAHHARSLGWDARLSAAMKEKDDMQQERDSEASRARLAESRIAALTDRTAKLQTEVRRLQQDLEARRSHRLESSEFILRDARSRLDVLHNSHVGQSAVVETELMQVLESLVADNEALKGDNAELQNLLAESREDLHTLQEEMEEQRANPPSRTAASTPLSGHRFHPGSVPSTTIGSIRNSSNRSASIEPRSRRVFEPLTPETNRRPLSPAESLNPPAMRFTVFSAPQPRYPPSHTSFEMADNPELDDGPSELERARSHKPLLLLTRSRGVQTDGWAGLLAPSPLLSFNSSLSQNDPRSDSSSSYSDSLTSNLTILLDRIATLHTRMSQADALTLTNRLKRQHLRGADVGHLSRSTVTNILAEVNGLRTQFRALLEDEKVVTVCTRKDLRTLFKLFRDVFTEMGQMRVTLNEVILDPLAAPRISELAMDPSKAEAQWKEREKESAQGSSAGGWMAPISKLFGAPSGRTTEGTRPGPARSASGQVAARQPTRLIPKLGPALSASATTVNVEFSNTGVGRSMTSTTLTRSSRSSIPRPDDAPALGSSQGTAVMGIFAGAPRSTTPDPWIVLPKTPRKVQSFSNSSPSVFRRSSMKNGGTASGLSRNVDAVIDVEMPLQENEESEYVAPLLERTLRRRGLSDSSIQSTYTSHGDDSRPPLLLDSSSLSNRNSPRNVLPDRGSVFQALSRTVQSFRLTAANPFSSTMPDAAAAERPQPPSADSSQPPSGAHATAAETIRAPTGHGGLANLLPNLSSWVAAGTIRDPITGMDNSVDGVMEDGFLQRTQRPGEYHSRDYY